MPRTMKDKKIASHLFSLMTSFVTKATAIHCNNIDGQCHIKRLENYITCLTGYHFT